ncbi:hypothetical protein COY28_06895 [Candidatus Woesearchaeota archaeon CG_4_10_14_0_2_um_filter_57_5]|nr:MAG: hypothetical protein AUJ68_06535 [Candidatus Woesearchaeota archaeon CG1_02_57_44]PIN68751.1 MAG: hypothetical protein COV94_03730 [Candidatus Woesearchaeota archaeon CG11_big_fil_rev_8_21_14_0_20_57_5]PIZ48796.1 MAG: hypothetical protein COY28_06895 [Candidatus Woesearchaeota archaeon CG_4_10_14_0_2_um_filter_57_5]
MEGTVLIPSGIFRQRDLSVLEAMVVYLKVERGMTYHEIAALLNRDDRTIWTCYNRAQKKRVQQ